MRLWWSGGARSGLAGALLFGLGACATTPGTSRLAERDPLEPLNRGVFAVNDGIDTVLVKPVTHGYRAVVPKPAQRGVTNFFNNVDEPLTIINALLQGKPKVAWNSLRRFLINTTVGVAGLADHATDMGIIRQEEDFGQTLAVWGVNAGPFIMLPLLGPSTFRDATGYGVELFADPYRIAVGSLGLSTLEEVALITLETVDTRSQLLTTVDVLFRGTADKYATVRAAYLQYRESEIHDGAVPEDETLPATPPPGTPPPGTPAAPPSDAGRPMERGGPDNLGPAGPALPPVVGGT